MTYEHLLGLTNVVKSVVTTENSALALKSGSLKVFATPAMIRLIEQSAACHTRRALSTLTLTLDRRIDNDL